ncbi:hypothetical protein SARC_04731 [Sphaeroforma arctica JP610]|uniref:Uncharacterized protein n=1 Tax=Sphaeroforma arctica JP610 TaxID=667725 RepID=A0A0L0G447_9EUKA|nr:hypothetical protein SARC_04731 [Sphaeroforma arctica JP610]KNC83008.1 hypothetical protein SARC_04731 [Sphaeroforma arctica JP610]|eukprot:XP_014156910.1 hypothetical protein SARC_04731 [Sphaeroforma arctica JP610]
MTLAMKRLHPVYKHRQLALTVVLQMEVASPCPWTLMDVLLADAGACDLDMDAGLVDLISRSIARLVDGVAVTPMMVFVLADIVAHHAGRFGPDDFDALFHMLDCGKNTIDADRVERTINNLEQNQ